MYYVYIIEAMRTSKRNHGQVIYYTGLTDNPKRRFQEHCRGAKSQFMHKHKIIVKDMVYLEPIEDLNTAINREKQVKKYTQAKKKELINEFLNNLSDDVKKL